MAASLRFQLMATVCKKPITHSAKTQNTRKTEFTIKSGKIHGHIAICGYLHKVANRMGTQSEELHHFDETFRHNHNAFT